MRGAVLLLLSLTVYAQTRTTVPFRCVAEELDAAGARCTPTHPCSIYLELSDIEPLGGKIFLSGNLHTPEVTLNSILLVSDDNGRTWEEPYQRIRSAGLEQIQFIDFENGWIGGQMLQARPHDAFLLVTHDGGKTWQYRPMFDETRSGAIHQFWFESRTNGSLLIDRMQTTESGARHELYESNTGGDSWSMVQVSSRPLKIKNSRAEEPNPDWRLRADAPTKSYMVERREGATWRKLASFPVHVGDCKTVEPAATEPPPTTDEDEPKPAPAKPRTAPTLKKP